MARKSKIGLDYFPHACHHDDNLEYIIAEHKEKGYYVYFRLLEEIYSKNGYYCNWDKKNIALFSSKKNIDKESLSTIINDLLDENLFNKKIFKKYSVLTSLGIQERYFEAIERRKSVKIINEYILIDNANINHLNVELININEDKSTQIKVKESKVNKIKVNPKDVYDYYLELDLMNHKSYTKTMGDAIDFFIKRTGSDLETCKRCLKRHERAVINTKGDEYPITKRGFTEFFSQKVYGSKELIAEQYLDGGKYENVQPKKKETSEDSYYTYRKL